MVGDDHIEF